MTPVAAGTRAEPFFLERAGGQRFCLFHPAAGACRGGVLYVHPFAEEMNRSRRMAALQARALAALGYAVLQLDLHGCGDSSGDFADARWDTWLDDIDAGRDWLEARLGRTPAVWGLRLGGLLAVEHARRAARPPAALVLWQPVLDGATFLTQFLRLRTASAMLAGDGGASTTALRAALAGGAVLEVAGYDLHPQLAQALDALKLATPAPPAMAVHWFDLAATAGRPLGPAVAAAVAGWRAAGSEVRVHQLAGEPFWATAEIAECPALLAATADAMQELSHAA